MSINKNMSSVTRPSRTVTLTDGSKVEIRALVLLDWEAITEEAAQFFKTDLIKTYARNAEYLPEEDRKSMVLEAFKRAEEIRADTLPMSKVLEWIDSLQGQLYAVWRGMKAANPTLTYEEAMLLWSNRTVEDGGGTLAEAASTLAEISKSKLGNESPPPATPEAAGATGTEKGQLE